MKCSEMPLISVIIPVFNVENYLDQCIRSVVDQTYRNLEIILIDDGATDKSPSICDKWKEKDSRIRVIHKNNAGLSSARNCGLDLCNGEYVAFLDSDDWLHCNCYERVLEKALSSQSDITCYDIFEYYNSGLKKTNHLVCEIEGSVFALSILKDLFNIWPLVWAKLYKRSWLRKYKLRFINGTLYEDNPFIFSCWIRNPKVSFVYEPLHYYRMERPGQITSFGNPNTIDVFYMMDCVFSDFKRNSIENKFVELIDWSVGNILWLYEKTPENCRSDFKKRMIRQFKFYLYMSIRYKFRLKKETFLMILKSLFREK